jgi:hypothetical protein
MRCVAARITVQALNNLQLISSALILRERTGAPPIALKRSIYAIGQRIAGGLRHDTSNK